ncbi:hypothetical protein [Streptomyces boninensis]|uniref:hypothetical protein n=1 Tax=Streptomyces boninensis TaxID=2039455 RepID=UPI003B21D0A5
MTDDAGQNRALTLTTVLAGALATTCAVLAVIALLWVTSPEAGTFGAALVLLAAAAATVRSLLRRTPAPAPETERTPEAK